jgi:hypothetical protein
VCLVSSTFSVHGWTPVDTVEVEDVFRTRVYRYAEVPASVRASAR